MNQRGTLSSKRTLRNGFSATRIPRSARLCALLLALLATLVAARSAVAEDFPAWAFPGPGSPPPAAKSDALLSVPGSRVKLYAQDLRNISKPPDWFPQEHPAMPAAVGSTHAADIFACGFCHLPNGQGRPENAPVAGLPAAYIRAQVDAFRSGERRGASPDSKPTAYMIRAAKDATDAETAQAAEYFSRLPFVSHVKIVESKNVPAYKEMGYIFAPASGHAAALGAKIIEMTTDAERFERRDPHSRFVAYVPVGSIARGGELARSGPTSCATCHGTGLKGGPTAIAPPLAGRSPTYLFRQLYGFHTGARAGTSALPMRDVTARLTQADMIALAAYAASLKP